MAKRTGDIELAGVLTTPAGAAASDDGEDLILTAGSGHATAGAGGNVTISAGVGYDTDDGGNITLSAGANAGTGEQGAIVIPAIATGPTVTANKLFNIAGDLTWNGTNISVGGAFTENGDNTIFSAGAGAALAAGSIFNFLALDGAGAAITTGDHNILIGENSGSGLTTQNDNVVIGRDSATGNMSNSSRNVVIGIEAFTGVTNSVDCIAIGLQAGIALAGGDDNIAIGQNAMGGIDPFDNTGTITGNGNIAIGWDAIGYQDASGGMQYNTVVGSRAGSFLQTGASYNTLLGYVAGSGISTGSQNTMLGRRAGNGFTDSSSNNVCIGWDSGFAASSVKNNRLVINIGSSDDPLIGGDFSTGNVSIGATLRLKERADHILTPVAEYSELWVKSDTPNSLIFTDDAGTDHNLTAGDGGVDGYIAPVKLATTVDLDSVGNGTWVTTSTLILTAGTPGTTTIDGQVVVDGDRIQVKDQTAAAENGLYVVSGDAFGVVTVLTRTSDFDTSGLMISGSLVAVQEGTVNFDSLWMMTQDAAITVGTTAITWRDITGGAGFVENTDNSIFSSGAGGSLSSGGTFNFLALDGAGNDLTTGDHNIAIGNNAMSTQVSASGNIALGQNAMTNGFGTDNVVIGNFAGDKMTNGGFNVVVGASAGRSLTSTATYNVVLGHSAMGLSATSSFVNNNVAIGRNTLRAASIADSNVAIGINAMILNTSGDSNIAIGTGNNGVLGKIASGNNNIGIGTDAGRFWTSTSASNVAIGFNAGPDGDIAESNKLYIHNADGTPMIGGDFSTGAVELSGSVRFTERADHIGTPAATFGELWVRSDTPNSLIFTDDAGTDHDLTAGGGIAAVVDDTTPQLGGDLDTNGFTITGSDAVIASGQGGSDLVLTGGVGASGATAPVGLEDGSILDAALTSSGPAFEPATDGRLNDANQGWVHGAFSYPTTWWKVDLGSVRTIAVSQIQGRRTGTQWITTYQIDYSDDDGAGGWTLYNAGEILPGNTAGAEQIVTNVLIPFAARYIRIIPVTINSFAAGRFEFLEATGVVSDGAINVPDLINSPPAVTTNKLYSVAGALTWDGTDLTAAAGIADVVDDTTPQLGGNLDVNDFDLVGKPAPSATSGGGQIELLSANAGATSGRGGDINLYAGRGYGDAGYGASPGYGGGNVNITGGTCEKGRILPATQRSFEGAVNIKGGYAESYYAGNINITGGDAAAAYGAGDVIIKGGISQGAGGSILITAGVTETTATTTTGGGVTISAGSGPATGSGAGGDMGLFAGKGVAAHVGGKIQIAAGEGGTTSPGGLLDLLAGKGGNAGVGGAVSLKGGSAGGGNNAGGAVVVGSGAGEGSGAGGLMSITGGHADANSGTGVGGAISITAGNGGDTSGDGGDITLTPGTGTIDGKTKITNIEAPLQINTQTGTTYTAVLADAEKMITLSNAAAITMTIPANASVAYPIGTKLNFMQLGAGQVTVAITTDTLNVESTLTLLLAGQYAAATAFKVTATTWVLFGNLEAA
jgi:hypothetical protein